MTVSTAFADGSARPPTAAARGQPITLALQGGGSLGAFAWGVLDRLLDTPELRVAVVSGASAGAMNAALLAQGLATGGPAEARRLLEAFWRRVAAAAGSPDVPGAGWLLPFGGLMAPVADALRQELRSLALAQRLLADLPSSAPGVLARLRDARLHVIGAEEEFRALRPGSHQDPSWAFLQRMRGLGHAAADRWLAADLDAVGTRSTVDLSGFAGPALEPSLGTQRAEAA